jgi:hypothetical protein
MMGKLNEVQVKRLRPTQLTVGMIEVEDKLAELKHLNGQQRRNLLAAHPIPAVEGPNRKLYITDHHHLGRAMLEAGVETGFFMVEADYSTLGLDPFWIEMDRQKWVHPYDSGGIKKPFTDIPHHIEDLVDDPYRSLAGYVRNGGGYSKTTEAFAEFLWADFFRTRVTIGERREAFLLAVKQAIGIARTAAAKRLPGYLGD